MEKNVQLKEEEVVGQESILSDIYPRTSTSSVEDEATGESMDVVLGRIYEMIHDKLTRTVNSVNGKSGAVILTSNDVGLANVDNVSFDDIKSWVFEAIDESFANRNFRYYSTTEALENNIAKYDPTYFNDLSFFVRQCSDSDKRPMIGRLTYSGGEPSIRTRVLNTVESTNNGLVYHTESGKLDLKIADGEQGLVITDSGLHIDAEILKRGVQVYETFYTAPDTGVYSDTSGDQSITIRDGGFLLNDVEGPDPTNDGLKAKIWIGSRPIKTQAGSLFFYVDPTFEDVITIDTLIVIPSSPSPKLQASMFDEESYAPSLKHSGPVIGYMTIEQDENEEDIREFHFVPFSPKVGYGLMDPASYPWDDKSDFQNAISVNLLIDENIDYDEESNDERVSYSNLQAVSSSYTPYDTTVDESPNRVRVNRNIENKMMNYIMTPEGKRRMFRADESAEHMRKGGMYVPTDSSLCAIPYKKYGYDITSTEGSEHSSEFQNYFASTPFYVDDDTITNHPGFMNSPTFLGVNLLKGYETGVSGKYAVPLSGLRIIDPDDTGKHNSGITYEMLGMFEEVDSSRVGLDKSCSIDPGDTSREKIVVADQPLINSSLTDLVSSGGLMVNVGKGLEIVPEAVADNGETYDRVGKVSVRIAPNGGLDFDEYNRLTVTGGGGSGTGLLNAAQLSIQSLNIKGSTTQATEENKARLDYEATTLHDPNLYGDANVFDQTILELGDGLAFEVTRNDFIDAILKRGTVKQIIESGLFGDDATFKALTWTSLTEAILSPTSEIFSSNNVENVITLNNFRACVSSNPYDTSDIETSQSPSTLLLDWLRYNPGEYNTGANQTISELITAYHNHHS